MTDFHLGDRALAVVTASAIFEIESPCIVKGEVYEVRKLDTTFMNGYDGRQRSMRTIVTECHTRSKGKCICQITGWPTYYFDSFDGKFTEEEVSKARSLPSPVDAADFLLRRV